MEAKANGDDSTPCPRLCHIIKWPDFDGYGFNLHAEKAKSGQYIGKVDADSPAEMAGLREGDRIIEVNLVNISNENHRQVVERIKSIPNETKLLVIDELADKWYKENKVVVKSTQTNVIHYKTPVPRPIHNNNNKPSSRPTTPSSEVTKTTANGLVNGDEDRQNDIQSSDDLKPSFEVNHKTNGSVNGNHSPVLVCIFIFVVFINCF